MDLPLHLLTPAGHLVQDSLLTHRQHLSGFHLEGFGQVHSGLIGSVVSVVGNEPLQCTEHYTSPDMKITVRLISTLFSHNSSI